MKKRIGRTKALELVTGSKGRFMSVVFIDKKNEQRKMNCIYAGPSTSGQLGYVLVKEVGQGFKNVNLQTMSLLKLNKVEYKIS